ncbi:hypothetical protein JCM8097_002812 [Rhodosporidiobolus ruineniae]
MGLAATLAMAYGAKQAMPVLQQLAKPSPYPPAGQQGQGQPGYGAAPPGQSTPYDGQAAGYYGQPQHAPAGGNYAPNYGAAPSGYNPAYAGAAGAAAGAAAAYGASHYGQQQQHGGPVGSHAYILGKLQQCVQDQNLQAFYPPGSLEPIANRISQSGALQRIAGEWRLPMEIAMDLAKLALFDVILFLDDSGSMAFEENGSRIDDVKLIASRAATAAALFDQDGIQILLMNGHQQGHNINNEQQASQLLSNIQFSGLTPFGTSLDQRVLQPFVVGPARAGALRKPVLVIGVTDGEPAGEDPNAFVQAVKNAKAALSQTRYGPDALSIELAQVGNDQKARAHLERIDNHPEVGGLVDVTSTFENEQDEMMRKTGINLTPDLWLVKLCLGGIDSAYDHKDERR